MGYYTLLLLHKENWRQRLLCVFVIERVGYTQTDQIVVLESVVSDGGVSDVCVCAHLCAYAS